MSGSITIDRAQSRHYADTGKRYFSVSSVCQAMVGETPYGDEAAMQRGTDLHLIFALAVGAFAGRCTPPDVPAAYQGYYRSMCRWIEAVKPEPVLIERPSVSAFPHLPFGGTPDLLAWLHIHGRRVLMLVDLKSGQKAKWHRIQVTAYSKLTIYRDAQALGVLYLHDDGHEPLFERIKPKPRDWAAFQCALQLLIWREST